MPYKTIQQNFANGELNPKMQGRSDVEMYYKSAQKMRDVATTPYGGFVRRPGLKNIYKGASTLTAVGGMSASTELTAETEYPVTNITDLKDSTYFKANSGGNIMPAGTVLAKAEDLMQEITTTIRYYHWLGYSVSWYAWKTGYNSYFPMTIYTRTKYATVGSKLYTKDASSGEMKEASLEISKIIDNPTAGVRQTLLINRIGFSGAMQYYPNSELDELLNPIPAYTTSENPVVGDNIYSDTNNTLAGRITQVNAEPNTISDLNNIYLRDNSKDAEKTIVVGAEMKFIKKISILGLSSASRQDLVLRAYTSEGIKIVGSIQSGPEPISFAVELNAEASSIEIASAKEQALDIQLAEIKLYYSNDTLNTSRVKLIPFVFNNEQNYVLSLTNQTIRIFRNDVLVSQVEAEGFSNKVLQDIRYAQTADTAIFVHPDLPPMQLKRGQSNNDWVLSNFNLESIPNYNFDVKPPKQYAATATPDKLDGTVKITFSAGISGDIVGQYFEGNGGRVKITRRISATSVVGYTIIGFYTTDAIENGSWSITQDYEPVWSETRGWPSSVTFHQGRLFFGGSKSRPQTVWGSKVGLFGKFDPTSGYDDDAVEFTLDTDTLNKITDLYSQRNLQIFTLGGEFICRTSYNEPITPDNVNASKQTANGSWPLTSPAELEGQVLFIERRGQALMNFVFDNTQDAYSSANGALLNSHLIKNPQDLDVEKNNLTQQTNYIYIVNKDGSLCVVNVLLSQGINGGFTLWKTDGWVKSVCVLPDATYLAVERSELNGNNIYLEKIDWEGLTDNAEALTAFGQSQFIIPRFAGKKVDVITDGRFVGMYEADSSGVINCVRPLAGRVEIGLAFRSFVESNILEVQMLGTGIGKKKRLASMTVRTLDTPELTVNGETQRTNGEGIQDVSFWGIGDWDEKPTWKITQQKPYKFNVLAVQMNVNYQTAGGEY